MKKRWLRKIRRVLLVSMLVVPFGRGSAGEAAAGPADSVFAVESVAVEGHNAFSTREILEAVGIQSGQTVSHSVARDLLEDLLVRYRDSGYPRAVIKAFWEPASGGLTNLRLVVEEGGRFRVEELLLDGCDGVPCGDLESLMETRGGSVLRSGVFEGDLDRLLDAYENRGYPYARIEPRPSWSDPPGIRLEVGLREGPRVHIDEIRIQGNRTTRSYVIERECGIGRGEIYSRRKIDRIERRLLRLGFFDEVKASVFLRHEGGSAALDIEVNETKTNSLYGAVGYVPQEPKGYLTGILDLAFGNIAGTGRSANVRWRTYQPGAFEWTFSYEEPWVLGVPLEAGISIHQEVEDSSYTKTDGGVALEYPLGERFWGRLAGRTEGVSPGSGGEGLIRGSRRRSAELGVRWDLRDDPLNPTRGWRAELGVAYGRKQYEGGGPDPVRSTLYQALGDLFVPVARRQVVALSSVLWWLDSSEREIPEHEQFTVGGAESLRGYGEDAYFGWRVVTLGVEYRFLLGRRSRLHVFSDGARLDRRLRNPGGWEDRRTWLVGYGFGLRSESGLGMIGVDFGLARGEPLTEGKIHLRLEGEF